MAVYDYATTFTQLLQQKYAKELCSDALGVKFINAQTIKLPRMAVTGYKDHTRTPGFNAGTLSNDWEAKKLEHDRDVEFWIDPMDINKSKTHYKPYKIKGFIVCFYACGTIMALNGLASLSALFAYLDTDGSMC